MSNISDPGRWDQARIDRLCQELRADLQRIAASYENPEVRRAAEDLIEEAVAWYRRDIEAMAKKVNSQ